MSHLQCFIRSNAPSWFTKADGASESSVTVERQLGGSGLFDDLVPEPPTQPKGSPHRLRSANIEHQPAERQTAETRVRLPRQPQERVEVAVDRPSQPRQIIEWINEEHFTKTTASPESGPGDPDKTAKLYLTLLNTKSARVKNRDRKAIIYCGLFNLKRKKAGPQNFCEPVYGELPNWPEWVLEGAIVTKISDQPEITYKTGQMFYEPPGSTYQVSHNASKTDPARLLTFW
jgi:hypothetical protein